MTGSFNFKSILYVAIRAGHSIAMHRKIRSVIKSESSTFMRRKNFIRKLYLRGDAQNASLVVRWALGKGDRLFQRECVSLPLNCQDEDNSMQKRHPNVYLFFLTIAPQFFLHGPSDDIIIAIGFLKKKI